MTPKSKKGQNSSLWYSCDSCNSFICHKDLQDHQSNYCSSHDVTVSKEINAFNWKHVFMKSQTFYGFLEEFKSPDAANVVAKDVVLLSQSVMQICEFIIGDPVIVLSKVGDGSCIDKAGCINFHCEVKTVWPTSEGAVSSAFCPKQGMEMSWGLNYGPVKIMKLHSIPVPAAEVTFNFTKLADIPEKIDHFISFLHHQMIGKIFHANSRIAIDFYGKKMKLIFLKVEPTLCNDDSKGALDKEIDGLISDLNVKLTTETKDVGDRASYHDGCDVQFYRIFENTKWILKKELLDANGGNDKNLSSKKLTLDDVGGYSDVLNDLKYLMTTVLKKDRPPSHYGSIRTVKGVLLYGLHGVGKTLIVNGLANSFGVHVVAVQSGDIFSKFYGEAESRLRSLFKEASMNAPSVIILDDIDTICPKRGVSDQERRVVATLLSLLDSIEENVIVLATTSQIHILDPALRRPGRLDREIELPVPSLTDREDILTRMLKHPGLVDDENIIRRIAAVAHGYVGADLGAVVSHAHARAAQFNDGIITGDILEWALSQVKPSAMREVLVRVPDVNWSDIAGQDRLKLQLRQAVEWPLNHPEAFARLGITPPRGVLMFGPPGCSKTMIAKALATESKLNFISIKGPELFSKWVGESERAVRAVFKRARSVAPSIIFLDELDAIAGERGDAGGSAGGGANVQERVLAQLLTELDGVEPLRNVVIVAATNRPDRIDKALLRPGRLDRLIYVPLPDLATRRQILHLQFRKTPISSDIDVDDLAGLMDGYSGAEVVAVCHEAALCALEEDGSASEVKLHHFKYALNIVTPRTPGSLLALYERYIAR